MGIETFTRNIKFGYQFIFVTRYMGIETSIILKTICQYINLLLAIWVLKHSLGLQFRYNTHLLLAIWVLKLNLDCPRLKDGYLLLAIWVLKHKTHSKIVIVFTNLLLAIRVQSK